MTASRATPTAAAVPAPARAALVIAASLVIGLLTRWGEIMLPVEVATVANSTAPWAAVTLGLLVVAVLPARWSMVVGAASFVVMDLGFYAAFGLSGGLYPRSYLAFWLVIAVVAGPLFGLLAVWLRQHGPRWAIAAAALPAICVGEGVFILVRLPLEPVLYPVILIVVGVLGAALVLAVRSRVLRMRLLGLGLIAVGALVFLGAYNLVPLVIGKVVP